MCAQRPQPRKAECPFSENAGARVDRDEWCDGPNGRGRLGRVHRWDAHVPPSMPSADSTCVIQAAAKRRRDLTRSR